MNVTAADREYLHTQKRRKKGERERERERERVSSKIC